MLLGIVLVITARHGTLAIEIDEQLGKDVQVAVYQGGEKVQVADAKSGWTLSLSAGKYDLAVEGGDDQVQLDAHTVTVTRGGQVKVKVTLTPVPLAVAPFDAKQARKFQDRWARQLGVPVEITNSIGMKLVLIPPGEFTMGSPKELIEEELKTPGADQWYMDHLAGEGPQHLVRITKPFYLGMYEVTQEEYQRVVGNNPSAFSARGQQKGQVAGQDTKRFPVECVSWDNAVEFCGKLSELAEEKTAGRRYRLPSEAQWEYTCRAGSTGRFNLSSGRNGIPKGSEEWELYNYGWFGGGSIQAVGQKRANAWRLYDVHGNVWEWCQDWYGGDYYAKSPADDPTGPSSGVDRVLRGGGWSYAAGNCRSAYRGSNTPGLLHNGVGLRIALVLPGKPGVPPASLQSQVPNAQSPSPSPALVPPNAQHVPKNQETLATSKPDVPPPAVAPFNAEQARQHQAAWAQHLGVPVVQTNSIGMKLSLIPPGEFDMGAAPKEAAWAKEQDKANDAGGFWAGTTVPQHRVTITKPLCMGIYPVTQGEYEKVMGVNPSFYREASGRGRLQAAAGREGGQQVEASLWNADEGQGHGPSSRRDRFARRLPGILPPALGIARRAHRRTGLSAAYRGGMGICVPCGNDYPMVLGG